MHRTRKTKIKVLIALCSLSIILSSLLTQRVYGTIKEEYEYSEVGWGGNILYRFKLEVVIETEKDDTWKTPQQLMTEAQYHVNFFIVLDYINHSIIESLTFYNPRLSLIYVEQQTLSPQNTTSIVLSYPYDTGNFEILVSLYVNWEGSYKGKAEVHPTFFINTTWVNHIPKITSEQWIGEKPIYIYEYEPPRVSEQSLIAVIGVIIGVAIGMGSILLGIKIGEKRAEKR